MLVSMRGLERWGNAMVVRFSAALDATGRIEYVLDSSVLVSS